MDSFAELRAAQLKRGGEYAERLAGATIRVEGTSRIEDWEWHQYHLVIGGDPTAVQYGFNGTPLEEFIARHVNAHLSDLDRVPLPNIKITIEFEHPDRLDGDER